MAQTATNPDWMTFDERMTETAGILAAGILRGRKREMNQIKKDRSFSDPGLDVFGQTSVHWNNKPLPKGEGR
ncbi:MAG: hypothetical protein GX139_08010 [Armatimonadetes bacterium]|jgi:hypothetical protein|nr:hypothetical protein [Armatimonadota bacterium]